MTFDVMLSSLQKSKTANSSKQEKDAEAGSLKKAKGNKGKDPVTELDAKGPKSSDDAHRSPIVHFADKKRGLAKGSDSELESETNFNHRGGKRHETVVPRYARVNFGGDFFYDIQSCSGEPANLEDACSFPLPRYCHFLFPCFFGF